MNTPVAAASPVGAGDTCLNCASPLRLADGRIAHFCPECGQETDPRPPTVLELFRQLISHYASVEGRLWPTLVGLIAKPGFLTREYFEGRRRRYIIPTRLYLSTSLLFFIVVKVFGAGNLVNTDVNKDKAGAAAKTAQTVGAALEKAKDQALDVQAKAELAEAARALRAASKGLAPPPKTEAGKPDAAAATAEKFDPDKDTQPDEAKPEAAKSDTAKAEPPPAAAPEGKPATTDKPRKNGVQINQHKAPVDIDVDGLPMFRIGPGEGGLDQPFLKGINCATMGTPCEKMRNYMHDKYGDISMREFGRQVKERTLSYAPYAMFLLLPVFALMTRILYWRRKLFYSEHMVYALHVHSFTFLLLLTVSLVPKPFSDIVFLGGLVYYWMALKRVFGGSWWMTFLRYAFIGSMYPVLIFFSVLFVFLLAIFF